MKPIAFPQQNGVRTAPAGHPEVLPLPVYGDGEQCISCWRASWAERLYILLTGKTWLYVMSGRTQPPVYVGSANPFTSEPAWRRLFRAKAASRS